MVVVDPGQPAAHKESRREDLREEIRKLETPHIRDVKSAILDSLAGGLLGKGLSNRERLTQLRGFCELGMTQLFVHGLTCKCEGLVDEMKLNDKTFDDLRGMLVGITVPQMSYRDERDRAAGLVKSFWSVPDLGKSFESYSQPERQAYLSDRTQEDIAHRLLNAEMMRAVSIIVAMLQVHGILEFEQAEPTFNIADILGEAGISENGSGPEEEPEEEAADEPEP